VKIVRNPQEWEAVRAAGKPWFLIRYGVLGRGIPLALLCAIAIQFALGTPPAEWLRSQDFLLRLGLFVLLFSFTGSMTANATWKLNERRFGGAGSAPR
jgi:hypothetical protein